MRCGAGISRSLLRPRSPENTSVVPPACSVTAHAPSRCPTGESETRTAPMRRAAPGRQRHDARQRALGVGHRVQRQRGRMARTAEAVRAAGVFFLQVRAVEQHHLAQVARGGRRVDAAAKALLHQRRQEAAVVEVGVAQHHGVDRRRLDRKRRPVALAQRLVALEQAAVEQDARAAGVDQVARAGDRVGGAEEGDLHADSRCVLAGDRSEAPAALPRGPASRGQPLSADLLHPRRREQLHAGRGVERGAQQRLRHGARLDRAHARRHPAHHRAQQARRPDFARRARAGRALRGRRRAATVARTAPTRSRAAATASCISPLTRL